MTSEAGILSTAPLTADPLTQDTLRKAYEFVRDNPFYSVCGTAQRPHVVSPRARGWSMCANCFTTVWVAWIP